MARAEECRDEAEEQEASLRRVVLVVVHVSHIVALIRGDPAYAKILHA